MSKQKDNRQFEYDIKYFRKVLSSADKKIELPSSLRAEYMRAKLDDISAEPKPHVAKSALAFWGSRAFSMQSAVSYALAFVLIVAVAYGLRFNGNIVDSGAVIDNTQYAESTAADAEPAISESYIEEEILPASSQSGISQSSPSQNTVEEKDDVMLDSPESQAMPNQILGMGGGAKAIHLAEDELYTYLYRKNDLSDPDKANFPVTLEIVGIETSEVNNINIPDISEFITFFSSGNTICFIGKYSDGVTARTYNIENIEKGGEATEIFAYFRHGSYVDCNIVDGILRLVTLSNEESAENVEITLLPGTISDKLCIVSLLDTSNGDKVNAGYLGADIDVSLHERNVYISFLTTGESEEEQELGMAQVKLDGMSQDMVIVP